MANAIIDNEAVASLDRLFARFNLCGRLVIVIVLVHVE